MKRSYHDNTTIKYSGARLYDQLEIRPMMGRRRQLELNRTHYKIGKSKEYKCERSGYHLRLPTLRDEPFEFVLELCPGHWGTSQEKHHRYLLRSLSERPFRINGSFSYEAFIERGDRISLGLNQLIFSQKQVARGEDEAAQLLNNSKLIESSLSIMIEGETGTGKSYLATQIHQSSGRLGRFIQVNLSSFSENLIESELFGHVKGAFTGAICDKRGAFREADKGTLFLDEIDSLSLELQTKILLFLDSKRVRPVGGAESVASDVRLIFASGQNLATLVSKHQFRRDLYYRLNSGAYQHLAPLRQNHNKIEWLCQDFACQHQLVISKELLEFYKKLPWPGNIRQLLGHLHKKKVMSNGGRLVYCPLDEGLMLSEGLGHAVIPTGELITLEQLKKNYVQKVFEQMGRDCLQSAKMLGVSANTVRRMVSL